MLVSPIESLRPTPLTLRAVQSEIGIDAPASTVWRNIVNVPTIESDEFRPALFTAMGFPRPVSATLERPEVGGTRRALFERDVLFIETVTAVAELRHLAFTVDAQTDAIPRTALDPHVTIGGRFFDVLTGRYDLEMRDDRSVRLVLTSRHRVSTTFNLYAGFWADAVMRSIQRNILEIIRDRCEREALVSEYSHRSE